MSTWRLVLASLAHYWRIHLSVGLGVIAATAVLSGALLVGDSVRGSLRSLMLDRLGEIDEVLIGQNFFRQQLAKDLASDPDFAEHFTQASPGVLLQGTLDKPGTEQTSRASQVTLLGIDKSFWKFDPSGPQPDLTDDQVILNQPLADELSAQVGDEILLRIPVPSDVPGDSPLGKKSETTSSQRLKVSAILPAKGLAQFGLRPNQQTPRCAFTTIATMSEVVDQAGKVNTIFVSGKKGQVPTPEESEQLATLLKEKMTPKDLGLTIEKITLGTEAEPVSEYINITSQRMMLPEAVIDAAKREFGKQGLQPALTYLANTISVGDKTIPYSTVAGIQPTPALGPFRVAREFVSGPEGGQFLRDNEIVLVDWAADQLGVKPGDEVELTYYEAESTHGQLVEPPPVKFQVVAVAPLAAPDEPPQQTNDQHLTPELKGVTDSDSIGDWDLPFELVEEIRPVDDQFWSDYRTTPKAYISLQRAQELWNSRFGDTTTLRIPITNDLTAAAVWDRLDLEPAELGSEFLPVKRQSLQAASGTTPFNLLFIGFSFFIIAAAMMLTMLLFRLGLEQRAREIGIENAVGLPRKLISKQLLSEGLVVAAISAVFGVLVGVGYAWLMIAGLRTLWVAAITTPFLRLYVTPSSLVVGYAVGIVVAMITIFWGLRQMRKVAVRRLLSGQADEPSYIASKKPKLAPRIAQGMLIVAVLLSLMALQMQGEAQAGAFFGAGGLVLVAVLMGISSRLKSGPKQAAHVVGLNLYRLAGKNAARNPSRSTLTIGLVAAASFLIVAISAFRLDPTESGTGGFALVAETDDPVIQDLNTNSGRVDLAFSDADQRVLSLCDIYSLRVRAGDDASCLNLYQTQEPRILGVPEKFIERGQFAFAGSAADTEAEEANPWLLLNKKLADGVIPVIIDNATATYSLHLSGVGSQLEVEDDQGGTITLEVVGLLKNSIFQGSLLISDTHFREQFPLISGSRYFLVQIPDQQELQTRLKEPLDALEKRGERLSGIQSSREDAAAEGEKKISPAVQRVQEEIANLKKLADDPTHLQEQVSSSLESTLGDKGMDVKDADELLASFLAVQNTYLSTFQSLGALGLLLGTFGLATVQLRSVLERRGELALMRSAGFRRSRLAKMVMWENILLLLGGLGTGVLAALVAVGPQFLLGAAAVPWQTLSWMLGAVLIVGVLAGLAAVRAVLVAPLLPALRGE